MVWDLGFEGFRVFVSNLPLKGPLITTRQIRKGTLIEGFWFRVYVLLGGSWDLANKAKSTLKWVMSILK